MRLYICIHLFEFESIKMMKDSHNIIFKTIIDIQRDLLDITDKAKDRRNQCTNEWLHYRTGEIGIGCTMLTYGK